MDGDQGSRREGEGGVWTVLMAQSGTCSEAAHSLPHVKDRVHSLHSPAGRGPGWSLVSSGLSVAASFASLPRSVAQPSGSLHWTSRDQRWAGSGYEDDVGSLVQVELRPGLGRGQGGVGAWEKRRERQLQVSSTSPRTRYMVPCTAGRLHAVHTWRCRVAVGEDVGDVGPALGPSSVRDSSTARCNPYLIVACIDPVSPTSAEKGSARGR